MSVKLVLVVRTDLDMGRGKIAAQVAHAAVAAALAGLGTPRLRRWLADGQPKVVLRAGGEDELTTLAERAVAAGLAVDVVRDAGRTQVLAGTVTCCAIGPDDSGAIDAVTGSLSLL
ncbi:MAG: peptidyl-tRNA hydrolase Pth2 [Streptosporangiaceae bacterium]